MPIEDWIIKLRREFHSEPEISFKEYKTQKMIIKVLQDIGIEPQKIADTGVVATIQGQSGGPCIALRADIDALEVLEVPTARNQDYISRNTGFMHACGHDGHIAMVLGAARLLHEKRHTFAGSVRLIFQPAEEQPPGGAARVIEEGGLDSVDAIVGMHIFGAVDVGKIAFREGSFMASSNMFTIKIIGKGGHHSNPEDCIDPILIAADFISTINIKRIPALISHPCLKRRSRLHNPDNLHIILKRHSICHALTNSSISIYSYSYHIHHFLIFYFRINNSILTY